MLTLSATPASILVLAGETGGSLYIYSRALEDQQLISVTNIRSYHQMEVPSYSLLVRLP